MKKTEIKTKTVRRIGSMQSMLMIGVAVAFDAVNILLFAFFGVGVLVNRFTAIFAFMTYFLWFALNGVSFLTGKKSTQKMVRFFGASVGEAIPVIGSLPLQSLGIWLTLRSVKKEDEIG